MPKVRNLFFLDEFRDYLVVNGYQESKSLHSVRTIYFFKDEYGVEIVDNKIIVSSMYDEEQGQHSSGYAEIGSYTGLSGLDTFGFMLLMHLTGAVPLKHFIKNVKREHAKDSELFAVLGKAFDPAIAKAH